MKKYGMLISIFLIGLSSLIIEIYSLNILNMFIVHNSYVGSIVISAFLSGLAISALIFSRVKIEYARLIIYLLQISLSFYAFFFLQRIELFPQILSNYGDSTFVKYTFIWLLLFIPALFIGGALPLITELYQKEVPSNTSRSVGIVYFVDMVGAILGAFIAGIVLIPQLGLKYTLYFAVIISLVAPLFLNLKRKYVFLSCLLVVLIPLKDYFQVKELSNHFNVKENEIENYFGDNLIFQKKSPYGFISVYDDGEYRSMSINLRSMCYYNKTNNYGGSELDISRITVDNISGPTEVLNIGLGCGVTAGELVNKNKVNSLTIVEINPVVIEVAKGFFRGIQNGLFTSNKVDLLNLNGADYLNDKSVSKKFGAIILDIEEPTIAHSSVLFTKEYFLKAKSKLTHKGFMSIWSHNAGDEYAKVLYNTLKEVFRYVRVKLNHGAVLFFVSDYQEIKVPVGSKEEQELEQRILNTQVKEINTLNSRSLHKYFDAVNLFKLPKSYRDQFILKD